MDTQPQTNTSTTVQGQRIEQLYENYARKKFYVNRRYQRKLVWSQDQKETLVDSILADIPVPLILLAKAKDDDRCTEIVDGLQRLNAIFGFIENEFSYQGKFFNLESIGLTKSQKDKGELVQREPILSRDESLKFTQYQIPVSTFQATKASLVDNTFRRINSSGRMLSRQDVRQAGCVSPIADVVREIAAEVRGDATKSNLVPLDGIGEISLRWNDGATDGVLVDRTFWVEQAILRRDDLRSSFDEQLILDLLLNILAPDVDISADKRTQAYDVHSEIGKKVDTELKKVSEKEFLCERFIAINKMIEEIVERSSETTWCAHLGKPTSNPIARYHLVAFIALYELRYLDSKQLVDRNLLCEKTKGYWKNSKIDQGGTWKAKNRRGEIDKFKGKVAKCFEDMDSPEMKAVNAAIDQLKVDIRQYVDEYSHYEFKQGTVNLDPKQHSDSSGSSSQTLATSDQQFEKLVEKLIKTATAMVNSDPSVGGVIYVGLVEKNDGTTLKRLADMFNVEPLDLGSDVSNEFAYVTGIDHELAFYDMTSEAYANKFRNLIDNTDSLPDSTSADKFKTALINDFKLLSISDRSGETRLVARLGVPGVENAISEPLAFNKTFFVRSGPHTKALTSGPEILELADRFKRFQWSIN
ncbi:DUF262 domain-containing protein [Corynebacterium sp. TAE3-ERU12]|uniref:DUF262 domain-containing protein n=1 Tax=Corynebacterium sp. TAE3-ERU12 TaxID=2849491 RepID=UPI001C496C70|nr:DUF262 domain-containing protein [Corynebacterium sp. TAE3-ERU12]MBV7294999.1 DUF262 domain-containing protein [Corynebacterium sp. TAE3-ERU12]